MIIIYIYNTIHQRLYCHTLMNKRWTIIEKVISTLLQAWALFYIYSLTSTLLGTARMPSRLTMANTITFKMFHVNYIMGVLCFAGGIGLLYDKRWGWVLCLITTLVFTGLMLVSGRNGITAEKNEHMMMSVSYLVVAALFAIMFLLLVQKPLRLKYKPNVVTWLLVAGVIILVVIDKNVF